MSPSRIGKVAGRDKFRPATFPIRDGDIYTSFMRMKRAVETHWVKFTASTEDGVGYFNDMMAMYSEASGRVSEESRKAGVASTCEMLPVTAYGHWCNVTELAHAMALCIMEDSVKHTHMSKFVEQIAKVSEDCSRLTESKDYEEARFSKLAAHSSGVVDKLRRAVDNIKVKSTTTSLTTSAEGKRTTVSDNGRREFLLLVTRDLARWLRERDLKYTCEQVNWQRRHIMGTALNTSAPGKALTLCMGYYAS
jgi:hypothetical protein